MQQFTFPQDFIWGAATASYQIEGAVNEDGRGESTWDEFCRRPGRILENHDGSVACDHYHRFKSDVSLMKALGIDAYRFSIAWPRIFPSKEGTANVKGIDFYKSLCEELLKADITPYATLFHWDLPLVLEEKYGGWRSKETSKRFADYAHYIARELKDYIKHYFTINETLCFTLLAHHPYFNARHAPGKIENRKTVNQIVHNALLGHGLALLAIRQAQPDAKVGFAEVCDYFMPVYDSKENITAAKKAFRRENLQILFPHFDGEYDPVFLSEQGADAPEYTSEEMKAISAPLDFLGLNYYFCTIVRAADNEKGYEMIAYPNSMPKTHMDWCIAPKGIYYLAKFSKAYFGNIPIYITENGMAAEDVETVDGEILDLDRLEYYRQHLLMLSSAIKEGVNIAGYFAWSLMDNFEWSQGYTKRFGLYRVNYTNQKRTLKLSGEYYKNVIKANRVL
jgi:beta-glucosidase